MTVAANVFVSNIAYALGSQGFTVDESAAAGRTRTAAGLLKQAGFARHWICGDGESAYDIAREMVTKMGDVISATDAVIYATCLPQNASLQSSEAFAKSGDVKALMDFPVSHLQADFGLDDAIVVGLGQQACTSLLGSIRVARALLIAEPCLDQCLCVTADRFPAGAIYEQAYSLISDGGASCVLRRDEGDFRVVASHHIVNGAMALADDDETVGAYFSYVHRLIRELLSRARLSIDEIDWVVPQNLNVKAWEVLARLVGIAPSQVWCPTLPDVGHVISGDNLINLVSLLQSGSVQSGQKTLLVMGGYGMNWQATLLEKT